MFARRPFPAAALFSSAGVCEYQGGAAPETALKKCRPQPPGKRRQTKAAPRAAGRRGQLRYLPNGGAKTRAAWRVPC